MLEVSEAEFDRVFAINVKSVYWSVKHFVPHFRKHGRGTSSTSRRPQACVPGPAWSGTTAAKAR
jgi:NAD(P)-dependent dehydrogenase (short-subunit alcohol dehydrogenase family)